MNNTAKKAVKAVAVVLCSAVVLGTAGIFIGSHIRGSIKGCSLPENFDSAMHEVNPERGDGEVRIMTSNLLVHYKSWGGTDARPRAKMFFEVLNTYAPDVVGIQEVSGQWYDCIRINKGSYKMLYPVETGALMKMTALMYNSDTVTVVDSGQLTYDDGNDPRLRRAVWGVFESKTTGDKFAVVSTHFDCIRTNEEELMLSYMKTQVKQINELSDSIKEKHGVPVFCVGDFNTKNNGEGVDPVYDAPEIYESLCETLTDTRLIAAEKQSGKTCKPDTPTWDHIFLNGEAKISRYAIVSPEELSDMSDHFPVFADAKIG